MKFSIRQLLGFVVFACLAASISRFPPYYALAAILFVVVIPAHFFVSLGNWRRLTYGGLLGLSIVFVMVSALSGYSRDEVRFREALGQLAVPFGFLIGATLFLALKRNDSVESPDSDSTLPPTTL